jgi:hypothetical protein
MFTDTCAELLRDCALQCLPSITNNAHEHFTSSVWWHVKFRKVTRFKHFRLAALSAAQAKSCSVQLHWETMPIHQSLQSTVPDGSANAQMAALQFHKHK